MSVQGTLDVIVQGTKVPAYYQFDGDVVQVHLPGITPLPLWESHATEYGSIYSLRGLFDGGDVAGAEALIMMMFLDRIVELLDYEMYKACGQALDCIVTLVLPE